MKTITFITGNQAKFNQLARHLNFPLKHKRLDLAEIQSLDVKKIVEHKAQQAYSVLHEPVIVEDTSLTFNALGKLPGALIRWFFEELGNEGLCRLLDQYKNRSAIATVTFAIFNGKKLKIISNSISGGIAKSPKGKNEFGWDPIFIPEGYNITWAEMSDEEQKSSSLRRLAVKKLEKYLKSNYVQKPK